MCWVWGWGLPTAKVSFAAWEVVHLCCAKGPPNLRAAVNRCGKVIFALFWVSFLGPRTRTAIYPLVWFPGNLQNRAALSFPSSSHFCPWFLHPSLPEQPCPRLLPVPRPIVQPPGPAEGANQHTPLVSQHNPLGVEQHTGTGHGTTNDGFGMSRSGKLLLESNSWKSSPFAQAEAPDGMDFY